MTQRCGVCSNASSAKINKLLLEGKTSSFVAKKYGLSSQVVQRHKKNHLLHQIKKDADEALGMAEGRRLVSYNFGESFGVDIPANFQYYHDQLLICYQSAMAQNDIQTAIKAIKEARECSTTVLKTMQYYSPRGKADDLKAVISTMMKALDKHPEAKLSVSKALDGVTT